jgi:methylated-DNA-[protein]-cysteine S-methyltransferase
MKELFTDTIPSPIGNITLIVDEGRLCALGFEGSEDRMMKSLERRYGVIELKPIDDPCGFGTRIKGYLAGDLRALEAIPVSTGGTPFQQQVWNALREIPTGHTFTYSQLAAKIGRPSATRAVGMTNSLNPVAIVVPCHRVIGANASLTGYAGGLDRKHWLLQHEGALLKIA